MLDFVIWSRYKYTIIILSDFIWGKYGNLGSICSKNYNMLRKIFLKEHLMFSFGILNTHQVLCLWMKTARIQRTELHHWQKVWYKLKKNCWTFDWKSKEKVSFCTKCTKQFVIFFEFSNLENSLGQCDIFFQVKKKFRGRWEKSDHFLSLAKNNTDTTNGFLQNLRKTNSFNA